MWLVLILYFVLLLLLLVLYISNSVKLNRIKEKLDAQGVKLELMGRSISTTQNSLRIIRSRGETVAKVDRPKANQHYASSAPQVGNPISGSSEAESIEQQAAVRVGRIARNWGGGKPSNAGDS